MAIGIRTLTDQEKSKIVKLRAEGQQYKYIASVLKKTVSQVSVYALWYQKFSNRTEYLKPVLFSNKPYEPSGAIMPPPVISNKVTTICWLIEDLEQGLQQQFGNKLAPIIMRLSDRQQQSAITHDFN